MSGLRTLVLELVPAPVPVLVPVPVPVPTPVLVPMPVIVLVLMRSSSSGGVSMRVPYPAFARSLVICSALAGSLWSAESAAEDWQEIALPIQGAEVTALEVGREFVFVAGIDSTGVSVGVFRAPLVGGSWTPCAPIGPVVRDIVLAGMSDEYVLVRQPTAPLLLWSSNGGDSWAPRAQGIAEDWVLAIEGNGEYPGRLYASVINTQTDLSGIRRSTDFGATWALWTECSGCATFGVGILDAAPDGSANAMGLSLTGFFQTHPRTTTNGGLAWPGVVEHPWENQSPIDGAMTAGYPGSFVFLGTFGILVWQNYTFLGGGLTPVSNNYGNAGVERALWDTEGTYLVGVSEPDPPDPGPSPGPIEVYRSETLEVVGSWTALSDGLPDTWIESPQDQFTRYKFAAAPFAPRLFLFAPGLGLWTKSLLDEVTGLDVMPGEEIPVNVIPNPSAGEVRFRFYGAGASVEQVCVVDVAGREIDRGAVSGDPAREWMWDGLDRSGRPVPAGVYFLRYMSDLGPWGGVARIVRIR